MIVFSKSLDETLLHQGFKDNIVEFRSDSLLQAVSAQFEIGGVQVILYPSPTGSFFFNFKGYVEKKLDNQILNSNDLNGGFFANINYQINFINQTFETISKTYWFYDYIGVQKLRTDFFVLSPKKIKYWRGMPFDISFYDGFETSNPRNVYLQTQYNDDTIAFYFFGLKIPKQNLSTLLLDSTILSIESQNTIEIITVDVVQECVDKDYFSIKFKNNLGGWSYWNFEFYEISLQTKDLGEVTSDTNVMVQVGKESKEFVTVENDPEYSELFSELLESQKIYEYIKEKNEFIEIALTAGSKVIKSFKNKPVNFTLQFERPQRYTRTL